MSSRSATIRMCSKSPFFQSYRIFQKLDDKFIDSRTIHDEDIAFYRKTLDSKGKMADDESVPHAVICKSEGCIVSKGGAMSKYNALWEYIRANGKPQMVLTFDEIEQIAGVPLDHSFLKYKKELEDYGYEVKKISMKGRTVLFAGKAHT